MHLRNVPTNSTILGHDALSHEPEIKQIFVTGFSDSIRADIQLYVIRKED